MIFHVDMDAFYASASLIQHPNLRGRPVIVGGAGRGVVLSATYEARASGVASGMPMGRARRLCPHAIILPPNYDLYTDISTSVMHIFGELTPTVEPIALDEAFLDVSSLLKTPDDAHRLARHIRSRVQDEQGITCSIGAASVKLIAKIASAQAKPDGFKIVLPQDAVTFLHPLPAKALWGVGSVTQEKLERLGILSVADIAHLPRATLTRALGQAAGNHLHDLAWGRDDRRVAPFQSEHSIGSDETFGRDIDDVVELKRHLLKLSDRVAARMRSREVAGKTVVVKVRFSDFTTITRTRTMKEYTDISREIYDVAAAIFDGLGLQRARVRLVGVRVQGLKDRALTARQIKLGERDFGWREADLAVDRASARFGAGIIRPASLMG